MDQGFPPVRHPRPDPISPDLHFDDVIDSITVGDDVYVRLSGCESVTGMFKNFDHFWLFFSRQQML